MIAQKLLSYSVCKVLTIMSGNVERGCATTGPGIGQKSQAFLYQSCLLKNVSLVFCLARSFLRTHDALDLRCFPCLACKRSLVYEKDSATVGLDKLIGMRGDSQDHRLHAEILGERLHHPQGTLSAPKP